MLQAALLDCLSLDLLPFSDDGFISSKVDIGGCDVAQALVISLVVVVIDESPNLACEVPGKIVVFQQDPVLHGLMPPFDFALGLRMEWRSANMAHFVVVQPFGQITRDVARPIVTQKPWHVPYNRVIAARGCQSQLNRIRHVFSPHVGAKLPSNDIATVIIEDRAEVIPTPANDLEVGKVGLPHLVYGNGFIFELGGSFDHHMGWCSDQISDLQNAVR